MLIVLSTVRATDLSLRVGSGPAESVSRLTTVWILIDKRKKAQTLYFYCLPVEIDLG